HPWWLDVEHLSAVTVMRFLPRRPLDEDAWYGLGRYLLGTVENDPGKDLVLNLGWVDYLNSMMVGRLLAIHKKISRRGGILALCGVNSALKELLDLVRLPWLMAAYESEEEALADLEQHRRPVEPGFSIANGMKGPRSAIVGAWKLEKGPAKLSPGPHKPFPL